MNVVFYLSAIISLISTALVISRNNAVHALLFLVLSFLSLGLVFYTLGAPLIAALEIIVYAGAIMVLFLFVVMLLNLGKKTNEMEASWMDVKTWGSASLIAVILFGELIYIISNVPPGTGIQVIEPKTVSLALFGPYVLGVELVSMLLLAGLIGAYHLGRSTRGEPEPENMAEGGEEK
jgi:NADH-quinone oxidoreductase subunit J